MEQKEAKGKMSGPDYNSRLLNTLLDAAGEVAGLATNVVGSIFFSIFGAGIFF